MINYKLYIGDKLIDLTKLKDTKITKKDCFKLEIIDSLTTYFENENSLKLFLLSNYAEDIDVSKKFKIKYQYKKERELPVLYKTFKDYFNPEKIEVSIQYLYDKLIMLSHDIEFLKRLEKHYYGSTSQQGNISDLRNILLFKDYSESELREVVINIFNTAVYYIDNNGEYKFRYNSIRDLAIFIYKYEKLLIKEPEEIKKELEEKPKTLVYEQLSMFNSDNK